MDSYKQKPFETAKKFRTSIENGLSEAEAKKRLDDFGKNCLPDKKKQSIFIKFLKQFNDFMVIVLIIAAIISFVVSILKGEKDFFDPIIILFIVILNAFLGCIQESKAEKAIQALKNMSVPKSKVIRDGKTKEINTEDIVVGDLIVFEAGDYIPADARIITAISLRTDESALTGESIPSEKNEKYVSDKDIPIGDRKNMVFAGTSVNLGKGTGIVCSTGQNTEIGKIASMIIFSEERETPLQKRLAQTGKILGMGALIICLIIFFMGIIRNIPPFEMFMTSISLAVAAIPEGLPAIVTVMLALGVQSMAKRNAVVRKLPAVETLGSADIICSDKTGTLTQNKMKAIEVFPEENKKDIFTLGTMCCDSFIDENGNTIGEPTENAIVNAAKTLGIEKSNVCSIMPRVYEIPFQSEKKTMTTVHRKNNGDFLVIVKGALEVILPKCSHFIDNKGKNIQMNSFEQKNIMNKSKNMSEKALRVIAVSYKEISSLYKDEKMYNENLIFCGIIGMIDPPRREVFQAVKVCKEAGIKPVMITGDNVMTAAAIAKKIGILEFGNQCMSGETINSLSDEELSKNISNYSVFARVSPEHKVRIVKAFQSKNAIVAMTGDGVNDAPALKAADIGCAMGIGGTDVAKEAADMILTDDNFASIVEAIKQGRGIYSNIKKAVHFLLSSNIGEIISILAAMIIGFRTPLLPVHLLWVNLVTDSLPAIALGLDPQSENVMKRKPEKSNGGLFNKVMWSRIVLEGIMIGMLALIAFAIGHIMFDSNNSVNYGRTMAFATLSISQLIHAFNMRSENSLFSINLFGNKYLLGSLIIGIILQASVIMVPQLASIFKVVPLSATQWIIVLFLCLVPIFTVEMEKLVDKKFNKKEHMHLEFKP